MTKREKFFGQGKAVSLDREAKVRLIHLAKALMHRTEAGRAYGAITAKAYAVLEALLYGFHNAATGRCFPSFEAIAERAGCARSTVALALKSLEQAKLLTWHNRLIRVREMIGTDLFGTETRVRVVRTSNAYRFIDPQVAQRTVNPCAVGCKSENPTGTTIKILSPIEPARETALERSIRKAETAFRNRAEPKLA